MHTEILGACSKFTDHPQQSPGPSRSETEKAPSFLPFKEKYEPDSFQSVFPENPFGKTRHQFFKSRIELLTINSANFSEAASTDTHFLRSLNS